jgi:hypothetical protein
MPHIGKAKTSFRLDAFDKVIERAMLKLGDKMEQSTHSIRTQLQSLAAEVIQESPVFQGIVGGSPTGDANDLQAHFGLTPDIASAAASEIILHVTNGIDVFVLRRKPRKGMVTIEVRATGFAPESYEKRLSEERYPFVYPSTRETNKGKTIVGQLIPWMQWVMSGGRTLVESTNPGISGYFINFDEVSEASRSGRAVMHSIAWARKKKQQREVFPYTMPILVIPKNAKARQFIDDIFITQLFQSTVRGIIRSYGRGIFPKKASV